MITWVLALKRRRKLTFSLSRHATVFDVTQHYLTINSTVTILTAVYFVTENNYYNNNSYFLDSYIYKETIV